MLKFNIFNDEMSYDISYDPISIGWNNGVKIKAKKTNAIISKDKSEILYNNIFGPGIDLKFVFSTGELKKYLIIDSIKSLGEIPPGAQNLEILFRIYGNFDKSIFKEENKKIISSDIPINEYAIIHKIKTWDSSEDCKYDLLSSGELSIIDENVYLTKHLSLSFLSSCIFPVTTDAIVKFKNEFNYYAGLSYNQHVEVLNPNLAIGFCNANGSYLRGVKIINTEGSLSVSGGTTSLTVGLPDSLDYSKLDASTVIMTYRDAGQSYYGRIGTVYAYGNGLTMLSSLLINGNQIYGGSVAVMDSSRAIVTFTDPSNSNYGFSRIINISPTRVLSLAGDKYAFSSFQANDVRITALDSSTAVIIYKNNSTTYPEVKVANVNGSVITYGSATVLSGIYSNFTTIFKIDATRCLIFYRANETSYHVAIVTVSGSTLTLSSITDIIDTCSNEPSFEKLTDTRFLLYAQTYLGKYVITLDISSSGIEYSTAGKLYPKISSAEYYGNIRAFTSNQAIACYQPVGTAYSTCKVVDILDNSFIYGDAVPLNTATDSNHSISMIDETHYVVVRQNSGNNYPYATLVEIKGETPVPKSDKLIYAGTSSSIAICKLDATHVAISFFAASVLNTVIGTISGTTLTIGAVYVLSLGYNIAMTRLSDTEFFIAFMASNNGSYGVYASRSGSVITYGTPVKYGGGTYYYPAVATIDTNKVVISGYDASLGLSKSIISTISGTVPSFGSEYVFGSYSTNNILINSLGIDKFLLTYLKNVVPYGIFSVVANVSGTSITYGDIFPCNYTTSGIVAIDKIDSTNFVLRHSVYGDVLINKLKVIGNNIELYPPTGFPKFSSNYTTITDVSNYRHVLTYADGSTGKQMNTIGEPYNANINLGKLVVNSSIYGVSSLTSIKKIDTSTYAILSNWASGAFPGYSSILKITNSHGDVSIGPKISINQLVLTSTNSICPMDSSTYIWAAATNDNGNYATGAIAYSGYEGTLVNNYYISSTGVTGTSAVSVSTSKFLAAYGDVANGNYGTLKICTLSGTTITLGSPNIFYTGSTGDISIKKLDDTRFIVSYVDVGNGSFMTTKVGYYSPSYSVGSGYVPSIGYSTSSPVLEVIDSSNFILAYKDTGSTGQQYGVVMLGTVSGTTVTYGNRFVFASIYPATLISMRLINTTEFIITYNGNIVYCKISGTQIYMGGPYTFNDDTYHSDIEAIDESHFIIYSAGKRGFTTYGSIIPEELGKVINELTYVKWNDSFISQWNNQ